MSCEAARELVRARWKRTTKAQWTEAARMMNEALTPKRRSERARKAAQARWAKAKGGAKAK